ncbi:MAG: hypothetical protein ABEI96_03565 [Haloarculaceae archaeon]
MATTSSESGSRTEIWDQLYEVLAAQPRRMIIFSLLKEPDERRLPLPDAAQSHDQSTNDENFRLQLCHHHLPKLADAGYVRWERDPFRVERGPHFEEPALVVRQMTDNSIEYPRRLREECVVIGEVGQRGSD